MPTVTDSIIGSGYNMREGRWGTCINGQTFQQEAITSFRGWQYAGWFDGGGVLAVARRRLSDGPWQAVRFTDYVICHQDAHNCVSIGISGDGVVHLAYDHHIHPLHYRRSRAGIALDPEQADWNANAFTATQDHLGDGQAISHFTYPMLFSGPDGLLQLCYRTGSSGDGDWHLATWDAQRALWASEGTLFSRSGRYLDSASRCAYPNPLRYGPDGRLHVTWTWRERPADGITDLRTNHDLCHAWSADRGRTWQRSDGGDLATPIAIDAQGTIVRPARYRWGRMNTNTQCIDPRGRVHVIDWQHDQAAAEASLDLNTWRYHHHCREVDGTWSTRVLPILGRKPQLLVDAAGTAWLVCTQGENRNYHGCDPGGRLTLLSAPEGWSDWQMVWSAEGCFVGEPQVDQARWVETQRLAIYAQERPAAPGEPSPLHAFDIDPR